ESSEIAEAKFWYGLPRFLYLLFKIYLLAVLVKIPIVLVYNFASLSRKLKFSSLFQSTFPQLIQLAMLGLIFYFFIAGWQAEKMRKAIVNQMDQIITKEATDSIETYEVTDDDSEAVLRTEDYEPVELSDDLPEQGILALNKRRSIFNFGSDEVAYFLFFKSSEAGEDVIHFARIEPNLLHLISQSTSILAGSRLLAYPYQPPIWESYLYRFGFWKQENRFRIFPFALRPQTTSNVISVPFERPDDSGLLSRANDFLMNPFRITIGRVIAPMMNDKLGSAGFFAFEILLIPALSFFSVTFAGYLLFLAFIYLLINLVVIRRMSKFGSEINQMIVQKFNQLKNGIREISTGNLDYKVRIEGEDEFVELAHHFNEMGDRLKSSIAEARDKERLQQELTIARNVQLGMLPRTLPHIPGYQLRAMLKTANEVGGDFYDVLKLNKNKYLFTIGDVSGKSTSAAFYMAQCISLIRYSQQFTNDPREIVLRLNKYFSDPLVDRQIFVTAIVGILDIRSHTIRFVRAGHNLPILVPGKKWAKIEQLQSKGLGLGLERVGKLFEENVEETPLELAANDMLVFYTDGLVEASRDALDNEGRPEDEKEFYGEERLLDMLDNLRGKRASEVHQSLTEDIQSFYGARSPVDDYTLLVIQKSDEPSD
ncbi:SpoIIE family protein phosphatase, partial [candidate division KSB1 bacterium]|nr:SpoIIE family protein phosphatase [candidate division KSB1 bacterium]NIR72347.1 SpoIIE family protein phosphatase [candidate division KSB1 bacterium]NIS25053.1 SpoIIE family protein phosphatase [candidate division KSB1 bacterium]NIT71974.1 SpoIIE family protein phosphatase [candidate division KSB1 bacterium]NIU25730.1 SpoIIE family protein phosphatase [candidate division KSB1 bacterium]